MLTAVIAYFTSALKGATVELRESTDKLWAASEDTRRDTDRALQITQRAYISVEPLGIESLLGLDSARSVAHIGIGNAGHLPARQVQWLIEIVFDTNDRRPDSELTVDFAKLEGRNVVVPGSVMQQGSARFAFPADVIRERHGHFLYVYGIVIYDDGFEPSRRTSFCHRYNCETIHGSAAANEGFGIFEQHARFHRFGNSAH